LRHAEILYSRARGNDRDRDRATTLFRQVAAAGVSGSTRYHCLLRLGDVARGRAVRHARSPRVVADVALAYLQPLRVLIATRDGRHDTEAAGDAYRALQQTSLRLLEQLATRAPRRLWPVIGGVSGT